ncbi:MAG: phosphatase PAP2 family protein [Verrucomicrobia bacterium]|nr:phosphatase PAP2 family protein [Verrucomicrobiota bacterium]
MSLLVFVVSMVTLICARNHLEFPLMRIINLPSRKSEFIDRNVGFFVGSNLIFSVFLCLVWYAWFACNEFHYRRRLLIGTLGAVGAGVFSRLLQLCLPTHVRPLHDPALAFVTPCGVSPDTLNHWNSFPSDHAAVFFGLVAVLFFANTRLGYLALVWALLLSAGRSYLGFHYPTDVLGGGALGVLTAALLQMDCFRWLGSRVMAVEKRSAPVFYMAAFFVSFLIVTWFGELRTFAELEAPFIASFRHNLPHH